MIRLANTASSGQIMYSEVFEHPEQNGGLVEYVFNHNSGVTPTNLWVEYQIAPTQWLQLIDTFVQGATAIGWQFSGSDPYSRDDKNTVAVLVGRIGPGTSNIRLVVVV